MKYTIGLDYGTNSVRALIVNVANGAEVATAVWNYEHGTQGVILSRDPNLARQHPADYVKGAEITIKKALAAAKKTVRGFTPDQVIGIGVDTTGSTPLPVDANGQPLAFDKKIRQEPGGDGLALEGPHRRRRGGGDHRAGEQDPPAISRQVRRHLFQRMVLQQDSPLPAHGAGGVQRRAFVDGMRRLRARRCSPARERRTSSSPAFAPPGTRRCGTPNGAVIPDAEFLSQLDPKLGELRSRLPARVHSIDRAVGGLTAAWAKKTGLPAGIPVAVGAFDAHLGASAPASRRARW